MFAALFFILGLYKPHVGFQINTHLLIAGGILLMIGVLAPRALLPIAAVWRALSVVLHLIVSPLILFIIYYFVLTPVGTVLRLFGWDPLRIKRDPTLKSYWVLRSPPGPHGDSYKQQF
jgi:hypothetical protein